MIRQRLRTENTDWSSTTSPNKPVSWKSFTDSEEHLYLPGKVLCEKSMSYRHLLLLPLKFVLTCSYRTVSWTTYSICSRITSSSKMNSDRSASYRSAVFHWINRYSKKICVSPLISDKEQERPWSIQFYLRWPHGATESFLQWFN